MLCPYLDSPIICHKLMSSILNEIALQKAAVHDKYCFAQ